MTKRSSSSSHPAKSFLHHPQGSFLIPQGELELFHYMIDNIGDEVMVIRRDGRIVFANRAAAKMLGYPVKTLLAKSVTDLFREKITIAQWRKMYWARLKKGRTPVSYIVDRVGKGGHVHTVDVTAVYMPYKSDEYMLSVARDITVQLGLQQRLQESMSLYRLMSEQAADGILMIDSNGLIEYANPAASRMVKVDPSRVFGMHFKHFVDKQSLPKVLESFRTVMRGLPVVCDEFYIRDRKERIFPAEFTATPILKGGKVDRIHTVVRDISRRQELESLHRDTEKMKALQNFIAGTVQEIQHPLKGVLDHSHVLVEKYKGRYFEYIGYKEFKDIMQTLGIMHDQVQSCFDTTNQLLDINRKKVKMNGTHCDANAVIREVVRRLAQSFETAGVQCTLKLAGQLPPVAIGALELNQVMTHILTNAIQAMPRGGNVEVRIFYQKADGKVRIECRDEGVGIAPEDLPRVFEPFFTTRNRGLGKSPGLGLAIAHSLTKSFQGEIILKSKLRQGTLVKIAFPVYKRNHRSR